MWSCKSGEKEEKNTHVHIMICVAMDCKMDVHIQGLRNEKIK
jgi:hypothetical protein